MEELINKLNSVTGSYFGFVAGISTYAKMKPERLKIVLEYINNTPHATTSDIIHFVASQPDFYEHNIYESEEKVS